MQAVPCQALAPGCSRSLQAWQCLLLTMLASPFCRAGGREDPVWPQHPPRPPAVRRGAFAGLALLMWHGRDGQLAPQGKASMSAEAPLWLPCHAAPVAR